MSSVSGRTDSGTSLARATPITRHRAHGLLPLVVLVTAGCVPRSELDLALDAFLPEGTQLALLTLGDARALTTPIYAFDPRADVSIPLFTSERGVPLEVAAYPFTFAELGLPALGIISSVGVPGARPLPGEELSFLSASLGGATLDWEPRDQPSAALAELRIPPFDLSDCAAVGCLTEESMPERCVIPCPTPPTPQAPALPEPPEPPRAASLRPCPPGWSDVPAGGAVRVESCEPPALPARLECGAFAAQPWQGSTCEPIGDPCPPGQWPELPQLPAPIRVLAGAPPGGDGSDLAPYGTLAEALLEPDVSRPITLRGRITEEVVLDRPTLLIGACVAEASIGAERGPLVATAGTIELRDLELRATGAGTALAARGASTSVALAGILISGPGAANGIEARGGARLTADGLVLRDRAIALEVTGGARAELSRVVIEGSSTADVVATGASTSVALRELAIRSAPGDPGVERPGFALRVAGGAAAELTGASIAVWGAGSVQVAGASASLDQVTITGPRPGAYAGVGIEVRGGGTATISASTIEHMRPRGLYVSGEGTVVAVSDTVLRGLALDASGEEIRVGEHASLTLDRVLVLRTGSFGIIAVDSSLTAGDLAIAAPPGTAGVGVHLERGDATVRRISIGASGTGIELWDVGSAALEDVSIHDTRNPASPANGVGLFAQDSMLSLSRVAVHRAAPRGIWSLRSRVEAMDLLVRENGDPASEFQASAFLAESSTITVHRIAVEDSLGRGVDLANRGDASIFDVTCRGLGRLTALIADDLPRGFSVSEVPAVSVARALVEDVDGFAFAVDSRSVLLAADLTARRATHGGLRVLGSDATVTRALLDGCSGDAVFARYSSTSSSDDNLAVLDASDLVIRGTTPAVVRHDDLGDAVLHTELRGVLDLKKFAIEDNTVPIGLAGDGGITWLEQGAVRRNGGPFTIRSRALDPAELLEEVVYEGNTGGAFYVVE